MSAKNKVSSNASVLSDVPENQLELPGFQSPDADAPESESPKQRKTRKPIVRASAHEAAFQKSIDRIQTIFPKSIVVVSDYNETKGTREGEKFQRSEGYAQILVVHDKCFVEVDNYSSIIELKYSQTIGATEMSDNEKVVIISDNRMQKTTIFPFSALDLVNFGTIKTHRQLLNALSQTVDQ